MTFERISKLFKEAAPAVEFASLRFNARREEQIIERQGVLQPPSFTDDIGYMITVVHGNGVGYAASSDLSRAGLTSAFSRARQWAEESGKNPLFNGRLAQAPAAKGVYRSAALEPWAKVAMSDKIAFVSDACRHLKTDNRIVDWSASILNSYTESYFCSTAGSEIEQAVEVNVPFMSVTAHGGGQTTHRSLNGMAHCRQGGFELVRSLAVAEKADKISREALELLTAPNCPDGVMSLLLSPDQMYIQIHESIGHPLELDRILGDERNYAGRSFVTPEMFGTYQYGSPLLNVTFDPTTPGELASYAFDDEGLKAERTYLIENGILKRGLGGLSSQARSGIPGVACTRASSWNRPPIDRMANINLEGGNASFEEMVKGIEDGIYMESNQSWSIDDSRNKFQFGCEWARLIKNGEFDRVVRNPNYRGISSLFWRNLVKVGHPSLSETMGTLYCGKGEPNQGIYVGHASPPCVFANVAVFGGE